ncbi:serine acetyltransferase [Halobacillus fulvus]|nr:serine acetyltransferase [Halobacillus fulvus]
MKLMWFLLNKRMLTKNKYTKKVYSAIITLLLNKKGSYIGGGAKFLNKPFFPHGINGVLISSGAVIGENAVIFHQVTIGSNTLKDSKGKGAPIIGGNCYIGAGAKIIGNVNIGNNVRIGANCVVVKDIPDNSVVVNQQSRIIQKSNVNNEFVCFQS